MKNLLFVLFLGLSFSINAQSITGIWRTVDDETGESKSHVEIYEKNGKVYGKIVKLLLKPADTVCDKCPGDKKDKVLVGMDIISDLKPYKDYWSYGEILDPNSGKIYKCNASLDGKDKLNVRGYIGFAALGRTQVWHRVQ